MNADENNETTVVRESVLKRSLLSVPPLSLGLFLLCVAFTCVADMTELHRQLGHITIAPFWLCGAATVFVPGLALTLGCTLLFGKRRNSDDAEFASLILSFVFLLSALALSASIALKATSGCGACHKLETPEFSFKNWRWTLSLLVALLANATSLFTHKSDV